VGLGEARFGESIYVASLSKVLANYRAASTIVFWFTRLSWQLNCNWCRKKIISKDVI